jgi:hypothetical protein
MFKSEIPTDVKNIENRIVILNVTSRSILNALNFIDIESLTARNKFLSSLIDDLSKRFAIAGTLYSGD